MGATSALSNLMIGLISGIAMGVTILIAQYYGAKDEEGMKTSTDWVYSSLCRFYSIDRIGFYGVKIAFINPVTNTAKYFYGCR